MESIWSKTAVIREFPTLSEDISTEVAVIGGGLCGILTAFRLQELGIRTVVLEASRIGSGQTKNTTAKITAQHNLIYDRLCRELSIEKAQQYANANQQAIQEYRRIIDLGIDCQFEERPACLYSTLADDVPLLQQELATVQKLGIVSDYLSNSPLPFAFAGGIRFLHQAQFHPLLFLRAIAEQLTIYENTPVKSVEGHRVLADRGTVMAEKIVFATHFPFLNTPGYYFARMHQERSYVLALENAGELDGMFLGVDGNGLSFRNSGNYLLLGGGGHRTGENRTGGKYDFLRTKASELFPGSREVAHWSAQDCMTLDGAPYIGQFAASTPDWFVATGFGKWGMTNSMVSALLLPDLITGVQNPWEEVYSPQRFTPTASLKSILSEGGQAVKGISRELLAPPRAEFDALPIGHGGIVECDGEKMGVYKDQEGHVFVVTPRCPHLGCQLEWNPDEKSWDCPCHGSRFDYYGRLIDNPAQTNLEDAWNA